MYTADEIVEERQKQIINEVSDIEQEIAEFTARLEQLQAMKKFKMAEYRMLDNVRDRGMIVSDNNKIDRIHIEDAVKRIFEKAGRPLPMAEIIARLQEFGYELSYGNAYYHLRKSVKPTGARGIYQWIR